MGRYRMSLEGGSISNIMAFYKSTHKYNKLTTKSKLFLPELRKLL